MIETAISDILAFEISNIARDEVHKVAKVVFDVAVSHTPVRTGSLRASWNISVDGSSPTPEVVGGTLSKPLSAPRATKLDGKYLKLIVENNAHHALTVENGGPRNIAVGMAAAAVAAGRAI